MKPKQYRVYALFAATLLYAPHSWAFEPKIHEEVTTSALFAIRPRTVEGQVVEFSVPAVLEIRNANRGTDGVFNGKFLVPFNHFDNELFAPASKSIIDLRSQAAEAARRGNGFAARALLGTALHTLQDFYSHSNWVETRGSGINNELGKIIVPNPSPTTAFCPENPSTLGAAGLVGLTSGYFALPSGIFGEAPIVGPLIGCGIIKTGKCAHGVGFFCPGINKDSPLRLNRTPNPNFAGARDLALEHTRSYVELLLSELMTGANAAKAIRSLMGIPEPARVGGTFAFVIDTTGSMSDDMPFVQSQLGQIIANTVASGKQPNQYLLVPFNDPQLGPLFGTPNADEFLSEARTLGAFGGGDCPEPLWRAVLTAIGESEPYSALLYWTDASAKDTNLRSAAVAAAKSLPTKITAQMTGSCSPTDPSQISFSEETGGLLLPSLPSDLKKVTHLLETQLSDDVVTISRAHTRLADSARKFIVPIDSVATRVSFSVLSDEVNLRSRAKLPESRNEEPEGSSGNDEVLVPGDGNEEPEGSSGNDEVLVPGDGNEELEGSGNDEVLVPGDKKIFGDHKHARILLTRPSGRAVRPGDPGVIFSQISSGTIITVEAPELGAWELSVRRQESFTMVALANSPLQLFTVEFVTLTNPVHPLFEPIPGQPVIGAEATARASLIGPFKTAQFRLVDEVGDTLEMLELVQDHPHGAPDDFVGSFSLPAVPFRIAVSGLDENGATYQRLFPTLFRARSVEVALEPATVNGRLPIGRVTTFRGHVHNLGQPASFRLQVDDTKGFGAKVNPDLLAVGMDETKSFKFDLNIPADVAEGTRVLLIATVTSTDEPTVTNTATIELTTAGSANLLPIANAGQNQVAEVGGVVTLNGAGSFDPDDGPAPLSYIWAQTHGPKAIVAGNTTARPSFMPASPGRYTFALVVNDGEANSFEADVTVDVSDRDGERHQNRD